MMIRYLLILLLFGPPLIWGQNWEELEQLAELPAMLALAHDPDNDDEDDHHTDILVEDYEFEIGKVNNLDVTIEYSLGTLTLESGVAQKITGQIKYDAYEFEPQVDFTTFGTSSELDISVESQHYHYGGQHEHDYEYDYDYDCDDEDSEDESSRSRSSSRSHSRSSSRQSEDERDIRIKFGIGDITDDEMTQEIAFQLPIDIPISMETEFGLGNALIDLSGLSVRNLELECGLSDVKVKMSKTNPIKCKEVYIESGLGDFNGYGLGNLRAKYINVDVDLGSSYIDLSDQQTDVTGDIRVGLGSLELVLPEKANIKIRVDDSFLSSVDVDDMVKSGHKEWSTRNWKSRQPTIELDVSIGLGSVDIDLVR